jgi:hypothetical protein
MATRLPFFPKNHPLQNSSDDLKNRILRSQRNLVDMEFASSGELCHRVLQDLKVSVKVPASLFDDPVLRLANAPFGALLEFFNTLLRKAKLPEQAIPLHAVNLVQRLQLVRAFDQPDALILRVREKVGRIVKTFPKSAADIQRGRNPGDVLDPYIIAATQTLMYAGNFEYAVAGTVAHKALMIIEGLLGHLHEDVIGEMRGNIRAPEPRGEDQENLSVKDNPFPGADVVQPPYNSSSKLRFHQIKSKTGSAKGGDAKRLGDQLKRLQEFYGGEIYYDALIGTTLRGHRSKMGVESAAPSVVVLVGEAAFKELTRSDVGPQLLLRVYQTAFLEVSKESGYNVESMAAGIVAAFRQRVEEQGEGYLELILKDVTGGPVDEQDSRIYNQKDRTRKRRQGHQKD